MKTTKIKLETNILQEGQTESFFFEEDGDLIESSRGLMIKYRENNSIPVRIIMRNNQIELMRGNSQDDFSKMTFVKGERTKAKYISSGQNMDIEVLTKKILVEEPNLNEQQIIVEYDLYTGLYLVGNYMFKLIFTK